jgi:hypothetical protein
MKKTVFCLADNEGQANRIIDHLISSGFQNSDISILYPDTKNTQTRFDERGNVHHDNAHPNKSRLATENTTKAPEGATTGATTGGILGGTLGLLAGLGSLAIPGVGPFIAAGPLMAALSGSAIGGSLGLLVGAIVGYGIPEYEAKKYEAGLKEGKILISITTNSDEQASKASDIMKKEGGKDISSSQEKARSQ